MAKKAAKRKSATSARGKKKSAKSAKTRVTVTSAKSKVAKPKVAKKTATRKVPAPRPSEDPCRRERDARDRAFDDITKTQESLSDFDIPLELRRKLEALLRQQQARLATTQRELAACQAQHPTT
jgi:hypothetical protein